MRVRTATFLFSSALLLPLFVSLLSLPALGQPPGQMMTPEMQKMEAIGRASRDLNPTSLYETAPGTTVILFHLFVGKSAGLDRSVRVDLTNVVSNRGVFVIVPSHED